MMISSGAVLCIIGAVGCVVCVIIMPITYKKVKKQQEVMLKKISEEDL